METKTCCDGHTHLDQMFPVPRRSGSRGHHSGANERKQIQATDGDDERKEHVHVQQHSARRHSFLADFVRRVHRTATFNHETTTDVRFLLGSANHVCEYGLCAI